MVSLLKGALGGSGWNDFEAEVAKAAAEAERPFAPPYRLTSLLRLIRKICIDSK